MLNRASAYELYRQLADDLAVAITTHYQPGDRLPSESQLTETYGVSRPTVRQALEFLEDRGLVVRKQGKGTFVSTPRIRQDLRDLDGFYASLLSQGLKPQARLQKFGLVPATPRIQTKLCTDAEEVLLLERSYRVDGRPLAVTYSYFHGSMSTILTKATAARHPGATILTQIAGLRINRVELSIRVQPAGHAVAQFLEVPPITGLLVLDQLTFCQPMGSDAPVTSEKYSLLFLRSDTYEFSMTLNGEFSVTDALQVIDAFE